MTAANLDLIFRALSDGTRRLLIHALTRAEALSARELAVRWSGDARGIARRLTVLEGAGLIERVGGGRASRFRLQERVLQLAAAWLARQDTLYVRALDEVDRRLSEAATPDRRLERLHGTQDG